MIFSNVELFKTEAKQFVKTGYFNNDPFGSPAWTEYWNLMTKRCIEGYSVGDVKITGDHYNYLNFNQIKLTQDDRTKENVTKKRTHATKVVTFPDFWDGDYDYFWIKEIAKKGISYEDYLKLNLSVKIKREHLDGGRNVCISKARRKGFSFKNSSIAANIYNTVRNSLVVIGANEKKFLYPRGLMSMASDHLDFYNEHTGWSKKRDFINRTEHRKASYKFTDAAGNIIEKGYKSEIMAISFMDNPDAARGKDANLVLLEEAGAFGNLKASLAAVEPLTRSGNLQTGQILLFGTGGNMDGGTIDFEDIFYDPETYNMISIENQWDDNADGTFCSFYFPDKKNKDGFIDKDGNSDEVGAEAYEESLRESIKRTAKDKKALDRHVVEYSNKPKETFLRIKGNIFPTIDLQRVLGTLEGQKDEQNYWIGDLLQNIDGNVEWKPNKNLRPILEFPIKDKTADTTSCVIVYEPPYESEGLVPHSMYIAACLPKGEKVMTDKGLMNVENVSLNEKLINKDGEQVCINKLLSYDKREESVYKIDMECVNRSTTYTQEHPLYLANDINEEFTFIKAKDAKIGMWTKYPNFYSKESKIDKNIWDIHCEKYTRQINNPLNSRDFWWFVGHWLGDGFNYNQGNNYTIYNSFGLEEREYIEKYKTIVKRIFNRNPNHKLQNGSGTHKFECKQLYKFLETNFGKYADGKFIAEWVKYIPYNFKLQLILGYLDSDGSVYKDKETQVLCSFKSINETLLNDIQDILFSIGVISRFNKSSKPGKYNINGKIGDTKQAFSLKINTTELKKLSNKYSTDYNSRKLRIAKDIKLLQKIRINSSCVIDDNNDYIYIKIKSIEKSSYTGIVYNFDCETHTFLCQYCTTHNCDPYDHDHSQTGSLGSTLIYNRLTKKIVAEYSARPETSKDYYEIVRRLLTYYNARCMYENERKGMFDYFEAKNCLWMLADQPEIIHDVINDSKVHRGKGMHIGKELKDYGEGLIKTWLIEPYDDRNPEIKNLHKLRSQPLLKELIAYDGEINTDRVSAMIMLMYFIAELRKHKVEEKSEIKTFLQSDFFNLPHFQKPRRNY